jgi:hypothetical protein
MACQQVVCGYTLPVHADDVIYETLSCSREGLVDLSAWNSQMASKVGAPVYGAIGK